MYGEPLSNDEEKCIDDILSSGLNEVEKITFNEKKINNNINEINKNYQYSDNKNLKNEYLNTNNSNNNSYRPKSSALKNLIEQLKKNEEYSFMNNTSKNINEKQIKKDNIKNNVMNNIIKKEEIIPEKNMIKMDINNIEKNNMKYLELKNEMEQVQKQLYQFNSKIKRSVSETNKEIIFPKSYSNKKKNYSKKRKKINIDNSFSSLNDSYNSNLSSKKKNYIRNNSSSSKKKSVYKEKYLELKNKYDLQREKIASENQNIISLENKIKIISKKNENYNQLVEYNKKLFSQSELLKKQIYESENIRNEQSKLIRSLQKEIEILRMRIDNSEENNIENLTELYEEMKNSLLKSKIKKNKKKTKK